MANNYNRGAQFERKVGSDLTDRGYRVVRSAGSHSPADIVALCAGMQPVGVQCKTNGRLDPEEWDKFFWWCERAGAVPVLASKGPSGKGILYRRITGRKGGNRGRQPLTSWVPDTWFKGEM